MRLFVVALDHGPYRAAHLQRVNAGVKVAELDETVRIAGVLVEDRQVSPRRVIRDVTGGRIDARGRAGAGELAWQIADLLGRRIVFEGQRHRQKRKEVRAVALSSNVASSAL